MTALLLVVLVFGSPPGRAPIPPPPGGSSRAIAPLSGLPTRPTLDEAISAAHHRAGLPTGRAAALSRRARRAAWLPDLGVGLDHRLDRAWQLDQEGGTADMLTTDLENASVLRVRVDWELDRLVFNPDELRAVRTELDIADHREAMAVEVTRLYFERLRTLLALQATTNGDALTAARTYVQLLEIEGQLHRMTGLDWSQREASPGLHSRR